MKLNPDTRQPSLQVLSYVLRHRECWPDDFEWNYEVCTSCAMGLAHRLWRDKFEDEIPNTYEMTGVFDMPSLWARTIFCGYGGLMFYGVECSVVTPDMVADKIDDYLKTAAPEPYRDVGWFGGFDVDPIR